MEIPYKAEQHSAAFSKKQKKLKMWCVSVEISQNVMCICNEVKHEVWCKARCWKNRSSAHFKVPGTAISSLNLTKTLEERWTTDKKQISPKNMEKILSHLRRRNGSTSGNFASNSPIDELTWNANKYDYEGRGGSTVHLLRPREK